MWISRQIEENQIVIAASLKQREHNGLLHYYINEERSHTKPSQCSTASILVEGHLLVHAFIDDSFEVAFFIHLILLQDTTLMQALHRILGAACPIHLKQPRFGIETGVQQNLASG